MKKLTTQEFIEKAKLIHGDKYDYSKVEYKGSREKICIICPKHGEFWQTPNSHLGGSGCKECNVRKRNTENFIKDSLRIHNNKYNYSKSKYIDYYTNICIICPEHGEFWQLPNNHLEGAGCPKCKFKYVANLQRSNKEEFIIKANKVHNNKYRYDKVNYINNDTKVIITCPIHGDFEQLPKDHLRGYGCSKCKTSKHLLKIYYFLKNIFPKEPIYYEVNSKIVPWLETLRFDIYFPRLNIAIEYNGEQHYIPIEHFGGLLGLQETLKRDLLKRNKCILHNCLLFEIKYGYNKELLDDLVIKINNIIKNENYLKN